MGIMVYSLFWVVQDLYHLSYLQHLLPRSGGSPENLGRVERAALA